VAAAPPSFAKTDAMCSLVDSESVDDAFVDAFRIGCDGAACRAAACSAM
jgi:hypothetical protein